MTRNEAIALLVQQSLAELSPERRAAQLLDWWSIDSGDPDYRDLPLLLKQAIAQGDEPGDPMDSLYDPLLQLALRREFTGVLNSYLERRVAAVGYSEKIEGAAELLEECPCCGYRSLQERNNYEICRVCFWEDDGTTDTDGSVSGPNRSTLREAKQAFEALGAMSEAARQHVLHDGKERYSRGNG